MTKLLKSFIEIHPVAFSLFLLTFFAVLAYLPLVPFMGFYSDDFFFGYVSHFYGIPGIMQSLIIDRPFNGYLLIFNYLLLGLRDNVFLWHIYIFLIKLIGGYVLFFSLRKIWPNKLSIVTSITLLFLIYPGFLQQTLPLGFGNWITTLTVWIISLFFTIISLKQKSKIKLFLFIFVALFLQINSFLQLEFFIGMEMLRLLIVTLILENKISINTIRKTFIYWSPYIISLVIFTLWRILIFKSTREATDINWVAQTYYSNPLWIAKIPLEIIHSFIQTVIFAYFIPLIINFIRIPWQNSIAAFSLGAISSIIIYLYFKPRTPFDYRDKSDTKSFGKQLLIIGSISILGALIPEILAGRLVRVYLVYDRYTITSIIGVGFIIIGFLLYKIPKTWRRLFITLFVFLSVTSHLMNGFYRVDYWNKQKDLWWQLYWRAPQIKNNAMLILDFPPLKNDSLIKNIVNDMKWYRYYWVDYQIWAPGNFFFNYNNPPQNHFRGDFLTDENVIEKIKKKAVEIYADRNIAYVRDFHNTVIISTPSDTSCLWVLDKENGELPSYPSELLKSSIIYSDVEKLVKSDIPIQPPQEIFGSEPLHNWCYYFEKASLARQLKDWNKLSQLKQEVLQKNLKPKDLNEWRVFKLPSNLHQPLELYR